MASPSLTKWLDTTASTKRSPAFVGSKRSDPAANLTSVSIVEPMPVDAKTKQLYEIKASRQAWLSYADTDSDIKKGDLITVSGTFTDAHVIAAAPWPGDAAFDELMISE